MISTEAATPYSGAAGRIGLILVAASWLALPVTLAVRTGELDPLWCATSLSPLVLVLACGSRRGITLALGRALFALALGIVSLGYAISMDTQATGFNHRFFYHLDQQSVLVVMRNFSYITYPLAGLLVVQVALTTFVRTRRGDRGASLLLAAGVLAVASPPITSLIGYGQYLRDRRRAVEELTELVLDRNTHTPRARQDRGLPKDVVLIYLESFERLYLDAELFGLDLAADLRDVMAEGKDFTDIRQVPGTGWTVGGMVASQCGLSVHSKLDGNEILNHLDPNAASGTCIARLLSALGYRTVYMGGALGSFAGKGRFLRHSGYDEVMGLRDFEDRVHSDYRHDWGLFDDSLFELATERLEVLRAADEPFLLTLLTTGTHPPRGFVSRDCEPPAELAGSIRAGVYCSARQVARFVRDVLRGDPDRRTLVVLVSDHLVMRADVISLLQAHQERRRLSFALIAPWLGPERIDRPGTLFDVPPTVLEALGFEEFGDFPLGQSLLSYEQGFVLDAELTPTQLNHFDVRALGAR